MLDAVRVERQLRVPSIVELLSKQHCHYVLDKSFQAIRTEPFVIM